MPAPISHSYHVVTKRRGAVGPKRLTYTVLTSPSDAISLQDGKPKLKGGLRTRVRMLLGKDNDHPGVVKHMSPASRIRHAFDWFAGLPGIRIIRALRDSFAIRRGRTIQVSPASIAKAKPGSRMQRNLIDYYLRLEADHNVGKQASSRAILDALFGEREEELLNMLSGDAVKDDKLKLSKYGKTIVTLALTAAGVDNPGELLSNAGKKDGAAERATLKIKLAEVADQLRGSKGAQRATPAGQKPAAPASGVEPPAQAPLLHLGFLPDFRLEGPELSSILHGVTSLDELVNTQWGKPTTLATQLRDKSRADIHNVITGLVRQLVRKLRNPTNGDEICDKATQFLNLFQLTGNPPSEAALRNASGAFLSATKEAVGPHQTRLRALIREATRAFANAPAMQEVVPAAAG